MGPSSRACCGQPCATAAAGLVAARACCCATFRSLPSVGQRFSRARPIDVCRAEPSISLPSARPGGASLRSRPRCGSSPTRSPGEGCVADPSLASTRAPGPQRDGGVALRERIIKTPCVTARQQGLREQGRSTVSSPRAACANASRRPQPNAIAEKHLVLRYSDLAPSAGDP